MNLKITLIVILASVAAILCNNFLLDWESLTVSKVNKHFDVLIEEQQQDLLDWSAGGNASPDFHKRLYCGDSLAKWSDNNPWLEIVTDRSVKVVENENGVFLVQKLDIDEECVALSAYAIFRTFSISNNYLKTKKNRALPESLSCVSSDKGPTRYKDHFYYETSNAPSRAIDVVSALLILLSLLIVFWQTMTRHFVWSVMSMLIFRLVLLYFGVLESFVSYPLFDSLNYYSSIWNPTLGDLFVNCILVFLACLKWSRNFRAGKHPPSGRALYTVAAFSATLGVCVFWVLWRILSNSQISLDVGQTIEFDSLRIISFICVILIICCAFLLSFRLAGFINQSKPDKYFYGFLLLSPLLFALVSPPSALVGFLFAVAVFAASRLGWGTRLREFRYENLQFALVISVIAAGILSFSVYQYHEYSELDAKMKFANHLLIKKDVLGEYYLDQMMEDVRSKANQDVEFTGEGLVAGEILNPYFDKYDVHLVSKTDHPVRYRQLRARISSAGTSDYKDIYLFNQGSEYQYLCDLDDVIVQLELKKRLPTSVFPALLTDSKYFVPSDDFDYAVFQDGDILFQRSKFGQGEWPAQEDFESAGLYDRGIEKKGRHYYGVRTVDGSVILIISKKYSTQMQLTNFSFFFLLSLFVLGAIVLLSSLSFRGARLNFTGKIQLYLGLAFIVPLFTAGFALLNSLNESYKEEIDRNYLKRSLYIADLLSEETSDSIDSISSQTLASIRNFIQADLGVYDVHGRLKATSQREIFDLGLQSELVNPVVFSELIQKENLTTIADESIGELEYKVTYAALSNAANEVNGFVAMPFFDSKNHLKRQQLEVFGNLVTIFGFIFIIAFFFGNLVLNNLMKPLRMVAEKISKVTLQEENKPILYESTDEIGSLVQDYNSMLVKLEESKAALARSQKEVAWKEIARQVAHEIKNPLTPMQLKIQQMLRRFEAGSKDHEVLSSLLIQVDTLSQIAGSFSAFAEMPVPDNTVFDFGKLVRQVAGLYPSEDVEIHSEIDHDVSIHADKDIFQRILNNIMLNAIQSVEDQKAIIQVKLTKESRKCLLQVQDNGKGIDEELKDKIFLNYFSTKSSGSGIGLALAKKGIENAGGNIWFESKDNEGTTFFISMPLATSEPFATDHG